MRRGADRGRPGEVGRGPPGEPRLRLPGPRAALPRPRRVRRRRPDHRPSPPTSCATSARTRRTRSRAASSRSWRRRSCSARTRCAATAPGPARSRATRRRWRRTAASRARRWCSRWSGLLQKAARRLDLDPVEIRRRNLIPQDAFPWTGPAGLVIDRGSYHEALETCADALDTTAFAERRRAARDEGRLLGIGIACFAERTGYGTEAFNQRKMVVTPGYDSALARMDPSGGVTVYVGTSGHGQGHLTTLAQVAADRLGLDPTTIEVRQGDTDATPYGWGTFASRSMVVGGGATHRAAGALAGPPPPPRRAPARGRAGRRRAARRPRGQVAARPTGASRTRDLARVAYLEAQKLPEGEEPGLEEHASFDPPGHVLQRDARLLVEVDPETGAVASSATSSPRTAA